jgi:hypothetical protein
LTGRIHGEGHDEGLRSSCVDSWSAMSNNKIGR